MTNPWTLEDRVAVVTGAASGIGREAARVLGEAGARVGVLDRAGDAAASFASELSDIVQRDCFSLEVDVRDPEQVSSALAEAIDRAGGIDIWVNAAGIREIRDSLQISPSEWRDVIDINLNGTFYCAQAVGKTMAEVGRGSIVNVSSIAGLDGVPARPAYCSSKFGIIGMTRTMAHDLGRRGVRVNAVCPGLIRTPLTEAYFSDESFVAGLSQVIPLGGAGSARDIANATLFLASDMSSYVTGTALVVDGGYLAAHTFDARMESAGGVFNPAASR